MVRILLAGQLRGLLLTKSSSRTSLGLVFKALAVLTGLAVAGFWIYAHENGASVGNPFAVVMTIGGPAAVLWRLGMRYQADGQETVTNDTRAPFLYLRSFRSEAAVFEAEEGLAELLGPHGPLVAIGAPGERLPPLGAARLYVEDYHWRERVSELIDAARIVFLYADNTQGVGWEYETLRTRFDPRRTILLVPSDPEIYEAFRLHVHRATADTLPPFPSEKDSRYATQSVAGLVAFDAGWSPQFVALPKASHRSRSGVTTSVESGKVWMAMVEVLGQRGMQIERPPINIFMVVLTYTTVLAGIGTLIIAALLLLAWFYPDVFD